MKTRSILPMHFCGIGPKQKSKFKWEKLGLQMQNCITQKGII